MNFLTLRVDAADFIGHSLRAGFLTRAGAPGPQRRTSFP